MGLSKLIKEKSFGNLSWRLILVLYTTSLSSTLRFNIIYDDDDNDEENTIPLNEITSQIPPSIAITPVLPTLEPEDSLIMEDENLSTIPEKEPDKFIKSSVEDLVPIPLTFLRKNLLMKSSIDTSMDFEDDYYDSEGDIIYLESLLIKDTISNLPPEDCPDYEDSRAHGFVHCSLEASILSMLIYGNPISLILLIHVTDIQLKDKNKAKRTKPSTGMKRTWEIKAE
ncbi:hypothetical protein Tco_0849003, partial [Tanacetum coccineum]